MTSRNVLLLVVCILALAPGALGQGAPCGNYDGCDPVILKVRGIVRDNLGTPLDGILVTGTENRRRDVGAIEFFGHCGDGLHLPGNIARGASYSGSNPDPGSYELLFIVCAEDPNDFAADFDICIDVPGYASVCVIAAFDDNDDRDDIDFNLVPSAKQDSESTVEEKGLPEGPCGGYDDCNMVLLKVRGNVTAAGGSAISNALVTGTVTDNQDVNAIQFYSHCGAGSHSPSFAKLSSSTSGSSPESGFYELLFAVCVEDSNDVLPDEFSLNVEIRVSANGYEEFVGMAGFNEEDDRAERNFTLQPIAQGTATETPTSTLSPTPTVTETPTPVVTTAPTALNPAADVDGSGRIDHEDLLEILENWYRIVQ